MTKADSLWSSPANVPIGISHEFTIGVYYFLPRGNVPNRFAEIKNGGFDLEVTDPIAPNYTEKMIEDYCDLILKDADTYGIKVMFQPDGFFLLDSHDWWKNYPQYPPSQYRQDVKVAFQNCMKRHSTFWGFLTQEEANSGWREVGFHEGMVSAYNELKTAIPSAQIYQLLSATGTVEDSRFPRKYIDSSCDVTGIEIYPITTALNPCGSSSLNLDLDHWYTYNGLPAGTLCDVNVIGAFTKKIATAAQEKPIWMNLQAYDMSRDNASLQGKNTPDYSDLRTMAFSAITHGANGILWWGLLPQYLDLNLNSPIYKDVVRVNLELQDIKYLLSSPTANIEFLVDTPDVDHIVKYYNGTYYVILLNRQLMSLSYALTIPKWNGNSAVNIQTGVQMSIFGGKLIETLEPRGIRVYKMPVSVTP